MAPLRFWQGAGVAFHTGEYDVYLVLTGTDAPSPWTTAAWLPLAETLAPFVASPRGKAAVRCTQLDRATRKKAGTEQEQARLEQEETLRTNQVVRDRRVLLLSEGGSSSIMAAQLVDLAWPEAVDATVLTVTGDDGFRLALDGRTLIDEWTTTSRARARSAPWSKAGSVP